MNNKLICKQCGADWSTKGQQWKRKKGKWDYRCSVCRSKLKPVVATTGGIIDVKDIDHIGNLGVTVTADRISDTCERNIGGYLEDGGKSYVETISFKENPKFIKKVLVISDLHCGHKSGLTPPEWFCNRSNKKRRSIQEESWNWFSKTLKEIGHVDVLVVNGDVIDGKGSRSGGTELITSDLFKQVKIAERCINEVSFKNIFFTFGTNYHVSSDGDDFEASLADKYNAIIKDHLWLNVNGCIFDFKHKLGSSSILQGRTTALLKEYIWNREWCKNGSAPKSDVFVRSHVHYCNSVTDYDSFFCITTPALQVADTKFGGRICTGTVDFGFVLFEIPDNYNSVCDINIKVFKKTLESMKSRSIEI